MLNIQIGEATMRHLPPLAHCPASLWKTNMFEKLSIFAAFLAILVAFTQSKAEELSLQEVAPGVYAHQGIHAMPDRQNHGEIANIGFIVGERCVAVIDSGGSPTQGRALKASIMEKTKVPIC